MSEPTRGGVGQPATIKLHQFGKEIADFFGAPAYLVGSALHTRTPRDVDVRVILSDAAFEAIFGERDPRPLMANLGWSAVCLAFAARGRELIGLPIDFQIQPQSRANEEKGPRSALIFGQHIARNPMPIEPIWAGQPAPNPPDPER